MCTGPETQRLRHCSSLFSHYTLLITYSGNLKVARGQHCHTVSNKYGPELASQHIDPLVTYPGGKVEHRALDKQSEYLICMRDKSSFGIRGKISFLGHRRYRPENHAWRRSRLHDGKIELGSSSGDEWA